MPKKITVKRAQAKKNAGKAPSTQAGEYVREQMDKLKQGSPEVANRKQAIAIGLSEARRDGVKIPAKKEAAPRRTATKKSATQKKSAKKP